MSEQRAALESSNGSQTIRLLHLAWPIAISMLSYSLMTAVDTAFVGRLGADAIALSDYVKTRELLQKSGAVR